MSGLYNFYLARIDLVECAAAAIADFNHDGMVNVADPVAYIGAFGGGQASADVDHNQAVNLVDFSAYMAAYSAATGTSP